MKEDGKFKILKAAAAEGAEKLLSTACLGLVLKNMKKKDKKR